MRYIVEICPIEPRASICGMNGESVDSHQEIADCRASGDCQPACEYVLSLGVQFRIVARDDSGKYVNRLATDSEIEATAREIYFDSESDFSNMDVARLYLIWQAAHDCAE